MPWAFLARHLLLRAALVFVTLFAASTRAPEGVGMALLLHIGPLQQKRDEGPPSTSDSQSRWFWTWVCSFWYSDGLHSLPRQGRYGVHFSPLLLFSGCVATGLGFGEAPSTVACPSGPKRQRRAKHQFRRVAGQQATAWSGLKSIVRTA